MIEIAWEFEVGPDSRARFEQVYGPSGEWTRLFSRHSGYRGTRIVHDLAHPERYLVTDCWEDEAAFESFRNEHSRDYEALDTYGETLTVAERFVGRFAALDLPPSPAPPGHRLQLLPGEMAVVRQAPGSPMLRWGRAGPVSAVVFTADETSIVCAADAVPASEQAERGFRVLAVEGPIPFATAGVLASLTAPLAQAGISLFAFSTYDTDYLMVKDAVLSAAEAALRAAGHEVVTA